MIDGAAPFLFGIVASLTTLAGGTLILRWGKRIGLVMGLSAGIVLGIALLELIPEALSLSRPFQDPRLVWLAATGGLLAYAALRRAASLVRGGDRLRTHIAPASLTLHSLVDGCGIGLAFQLSPDVGWGVAIAVLSHDLADGANVAGLSLAAHGHRVARRWLLLNGLAPLVGVTIGQLVAIPPLLLVNLLAALAGAFLFIGVSELLPNSFRLNRRLGAALSGSAGFLLVYAGTLLHA